MPVHAERTSVNSLNSDICDTDAAHIRFREKEFGIRTYRCYSCSENFSAESLVNVLEHYARHTSQHKGFHSPCLYCGGKVHKYVRERNTKHPAKEDDINFYHDCGRWKRKQDH